MIVFDLSCENHHRFEGWFASSEDFERQLEAKLVACPLCGSVAVARLPHPVYIKGKASEPAAAEGAKRGAVEQYANFGNELLNKVIEHILQNTEDVGPRFPEEARKIHYREAPARMIRGTASREEVEELQEEGIEVVALPIPAYRLSKPH